MSENDYVVRLKEKLLHLPGENSICDSPRTNVYFAMGVIFDSIEEMLLDEGVVPVVEVARRINIGFSGEMGRVLDVGELSNVLKNQALVFRNIGSFESSSGVTPGFDVYPTTIGDAIEKNFGEIDDAKRARLKELGLRPDSTILYASEKRLDEYVERTFK